MARNNPENVGPHYSQIAYQRNDMAPETMTHYFGGGGCDNYDVLVADLPFDFLQPQLRRQVTQVGYGGPFVIRSNPIGAIVDAVRNFCYPAPMEENGDGYSDLSGMGLGTYGDYTSPMLTPEAYPYSGPVSSGVPPPQMPAAPMTCAAGNMWDASKMMCVPTAGTSPMPGMEQPADCSFAHYTDQNTRVPLATAKALKKDFADLCNISTNARRCEMSLPAGPLKTAWQVLANTTKATLQANGCQSCNTCVQPNPPGSANTMPVGTPGNAMTSGMMPMGNGMVTPPAGGSPGTNNMNTMPTSGSTTSDGKGPSGNEVNTVVAPNPMGGPFGYIALADAAKMGLADLSPAAAQGYAPSMAAPPLPNTVNPMSLTEGNIYLAPSAEPMQGSFDPAKAANPFQRGRSAAERTREGVRARVGSFSARMMRGR